MIVEYLRDKSKDMPNLENVNDIKYLRLWYCKYKSIEAVSNCKNLVGLEIAGFNEDSFYMLSALKNLKTLRVLHLPKLKSLEGLECLHNLESLSLETPPSWDASRRKVVVKSYKPISNLKMLISLNLLGVVPEDQDVSVLNELTRLEYAQIAGVAPDRVSEFYNGNPNVEKKYYFPRF